MATDKQGRIVKIQHNGLKHYAVVRDKVDTGIFKVSFPMYMAGSIAIVDKDLPVAEIRSVSLSQSSPTAVLLRQLTGIHLAGSTAKQPTAASGKIGKAQPASAEPAITQQQNAEPTPAQIDEFTIGGVAIKDMAEGHEKELAKGIAKNFIPTGCKGIDSL